MKTEHILVIRFSAIGDVAMTVPVIYSLAKQYPNVRITMLSRPFARPFYENLAPNVSFMEADVKQEYHGIKGLNALYRRLTAKHFTAIADLHNVLRSNFLRLRFNLDNFKVAHIDKHRKGKHMLCSFNNKKLIQQPTAFQNYADVFAELGYPIQMNFTSIFPPGGGNLRLLPEHIIGKKQAFSQWIGIAPFAAHHGKIYPVELMEKVVERLGEQDNLRIFFFGAGKTEQQQFNDWAAKWSFCVNASGQLGGLQQELALMSQLDAMLTMDSANSRGKRMGCHTSLCRLHGLEPVDGQCHSSGPSMPPMLHLWQEGMPSRRLCLPDHHPSKSDCRPSFAAHQSLSSNRRANSQITIPAVTATFMECFVPN